MSRDSTHATGPPFIPEFARSASTWLAFGLSLLIHSISFIALGYLPQLSRPYSPPQLRYAQGKPPLEVTVRFISTEELEALTIPKAEPQTHPQDNTEESTSPSPSVNLTQPTTAQNTHDDLMDHLLPVLDAAAASVKDAIALIELHLPQQPEPPSEQYSPPITEQHLEEDPPPELPFTPHDTISTKQMAASNPTEKPPLPVYQQSQQDATTGQLTNSVVSKPPTQSGIETGVKAFNLPKPEYPRRSRRLGEEGLVLLEVEVLPDGRAGQIRVLNNPSYPRLIQAAIAAVRAARFTPAMRNGRSVRTWVEIPFEFRLSRS